MNDIYPLLTDQPANDAALCKLRRKARYEAGREIRNLRRQFATQMPHEAVYPRILDVENALLSRKQPLQLRASARMGDEPNREAAPT